MRWYTQRKAALVAAIAAPLLATSYVAALARDSAFPALGKPITIIVPYAPGGVTDTGARLMAGAVFLDGFLKSYREIGTGRLAAAPR